MVAETRLRTGGQTEATTDTLMELAPLRPDDSRLGPPPFGRIVKSPPDLTRPLDAGTLHDLDGALAAHGLLVIEGQYELRPAMEWSFLSSFPWLDPEHAASLKTADVGWWQFPDCPMVRRLGDAVDEAGNPAGLLNRIGYEWHTDGGGATLLYCERAPESPPRTTLFASGAAAYEALPHDERMEAETILVCYSTRFVTGDTATIDYEAGVRMTPNGLRLAETARPDAVRGRRGKAAHERPLVRVHPPTARKVLWASPKNMDHLEIGKRVLPVEQSRARLEELLRYGTAVEETALVYEHRWQPGDVVLMDNRQVLHSTTPYANDRHGRGRQLMHHVLMKARRPQEGWTDVGVLRRTG